MRESGGAIGKIGNIGYPLPASESTDCERFPTHAAPYNTHLIRTCQTRVTLIPLSVCITHFLVQRRHAQCCHSRMNIDCRELCYVVASSFLLSHVASVVIYNISVHLRLRYYSGIVDRVVHVYIMSILCLRTRCINVHHLFVYILV